MTDKDFMAQLARLEEEMAEAQVRMEALEHRSSAMENRQVRLEKLVGQSSLQLIKLEKAVLAMHHDFSQEVVDKIARIHDLLSRATGSGCLFKADHERRELAEALGEKTKVGEP